MTFAKRNAAAKWGKFKNTENVKLNDIFNISNICINNTTQPDNKFRKEINVTEGRISHAVEVYAFHMLAIIQINDSIIGMFFEEIKNLRLSMEPDTALHKTQNDYKILQEFCCITNPRHIVDCSNRLALEK